MINWLNQEYIDTGLAASTALVNVGTEEVVNRADVIGPVDL